MRCDLLEILVRGGNETGGVESERSDIVVLGDAVHLDVGGTHRPRQHAGEGREEVEDGEGHQGHVVGHDSPRGNSLSVSNACTTKQEERQRRHLSDNIRI